MDIRLFSACIFLSAIICRTVWSCREKIAHGTVRGYCEELCSYWCDEGYEKDPDTPFLDCDVKNNTWVHYDDDDIRVSEDQLCRPKRCPDITVPNGGLSDCVPTVGSTCSYFCEPGYNQTSSHISCLPSTEWSVSPLVLCTSHKQCPYEIPSGALNVSCSRNPGDSCSFSCDVGMITDVPSKTLTCGRKSRKSSWNKALDSVCKSVQCPAAIPNGHIASSCARGFEDRCHYHCNDGFMKSSLITFLKCNGSAQWEWYFQKDNPTLCLDKSKLCPKLIENGKIDKYCDRNTGSKCTYSCDRGCYRNKEVSQLTCDNSLTWKPQTPLCWDCGVGTCKRGIPHGRISSNDCQELCLYYCDQGYEQSLKLHALKCSLNNTWVPKYEDKIVPEDDLCRAKSCPNITIPNGEIGICPGKVDTTCSYSCRNGYNQKSSDIACLTSTEWDSNPHTLCTNDMQCPYKIAKGALNMSCTRNPSQTCTYSCDEGHLPVDVSRTVTCGSDSSWDQPLHSICPVIQCPERIPHGSIPSSCRRGFEEYCGYNCDQGYEKADNYHLKCNGSAQWEIRWAWLHENPVLCTPKNCPEIYIPNGEVSTCNMAVDSSCSYSCKTGYNQTTPHVTCMPSQTWNPPQHTLCINETQCPHVIPRGELNATCGRNYGETCNYSCIEETIAFNTSRTIICGANALWNIPLDTICTVIECPTNIAKAKLSTSCDRGYHDECLYYTCPPGYDKESLPLRMRCNESSKWEVEWNKQPYVGELCTARSCPKLYVPNGIYGKCLAKVDSVCSYVCNEGYRQKSQSVTCLSTQQWDLDMHSLCTNSEQCEPYQIPNGQLEIKCGRNPGSSCSFTCDEGMMPRSGTVYCHKRNSYWDQYFAHLCTVLRCPDTIPGGYVPISQCGRSLNDRCDTIWCNSGFEMVRHTSSNKPYLRCNESAQWETHWRGSFLSTQLCLDKSKMCPSTIKNGTFSKSCQRTVGATCPFDCDSHCSQLYSYLTCLGDFTWTNGDTACFNCHIPTTPVPVCTRTIPNGRISSVCSRHIGSYCDYYCDYGCKKTRTTLFCRTLGYWGYKYSACDCDYRTTATYNNADIYDSDDESEGSSGLTTILIILGVLVFLVVICVFIYAWKKQQHESPQPTPQPSSDSPVVYHPVTTNTPVVTNGRRDSPPNYNSLGPRDHRNLEPLIPDTLTAPSAPEAPTEGPGNRMSPSASGIDLDGYPPPPSYIEVVSDPDKYQTHTEHQELQAD